MSNKEEYKAYCEKMGSKIPIYSQHWWMEAVCTGKQWDVIIIKNKGGEIIATMPYLYRERFGMKYILMPPLTQTNGIHIQYPADQNEHHRICYEKVICYEVDRQLSDLGLNIYLQNFEPGFTNWLPLKWRGYKQTTRYTYRIEDLSNLQKVFDNFDRNKKRLIKKAESLGLQCTTDMSATELYEMHSKILERKGEKHLVPKEVFVKVIETAISRGQGQILCIYHKEGEKRINESSIFIAWDDETTYYLISAHDPTYAPFGTSSLITWEAIKLASQHSKVFDFEGSMEENIEDSFNRFGTHQTPYMQISKTQGFVAKMLKVFQELRH